MQSAKVKILTSLQYDVEHNVPSAIFVPYKFALWRTQLECFGKNTS